MLDALELRRLLAIPVAGGVATINGSGGNDVLEIVLNSGILQLRNSAGTVIDFVSGVGVNSVVVNAGDGNDFVRFGRADGSLMPNVNATIRGNPGNDTLIGTNRDDQIFGDVDNDKLDGRAGRDLLDGSSGFDTVDYGYRTVAVQVSLLNNGVGNDGSNSGNNSSPSQYNDLGGDNVANMEAVVGGSAADRLVGSAAANWFDGGGGNDSIFGGAGIDTIVGGVNNDLAYGENEDDFFFVQDSTGDQFLGGPGTTSAQFDSGLDTPAPPLGTSPTSLTGPGDFLRGLRGSPRADGDELELDSTFGPFSNGKVFTFIGDVLVQINDVAIQKVTDGEVVEEKIIAVGAALGPNETFDFLLLRYDSDGSLDTSFGEDETGIVYTDFGFGEVFTTDVANSVAIDDDGNIVVAGSSVVNVIGRAAGFADFAIAKYLSDGTPDDEFNGNGQILIDPDNADSDAVAARIAITQIETEGGPQDVYVVAGTIGPEFVSESSESQDFGVVRLSSSGAFDESFGLVRADFGSEGESVDTLTGLAVDSRNGNIWLSGYTSQSGGSSDFAVAGFFEDGTPIESSHTTLSFGGDDRASDSVIDGTRLIVVGTTSNDGPSVGAIASFDINVIPSRGPGDVLESTTYTDERFDNLELSGVAIDNDGHGVAVGTVDGDDFYVLRFNTTDLSPFGAPATVDFALEGTTADLAAGVAIQSDGKIVVGGTSDDSAAIARLKSKQEGFVDVTLTPEDVQNFNFTYPDDNGNPQPVPNFLVRRVKALKPDGTLEIFGDDLFNAIKITQANGIITVDTDGDLFQVNASQVTRVIVHGLDGDDVIDTDGTLSVPLIFEGNAGNDCLRGGSLGDQLLGGSGHDLLVGRGGADLLLGEDGFDLLIGGNGPDTARGGAGEDILIGGRTSFDDDLPSLKLLLNEWSNPNHNAGQRFGQLQGGGVGSGLNGNIVLKSGQTVLDDNTADVLEGGAGDDWFFAKKGSDTILDQAKHEKVT